MALLTVENLSFAYPGAKVRALSKVSAEVEEGSFVLLCGESGCGKSTLLKHFKKELTPSGVREGEVCFCGQKIETLDGHASATGIGFVMQNIENQIVTDKVYAELAFGLESLGTDNETMRRRIAEMASFFGIHSWFRSDTSKLSGGQKQMLNLASVMVMQPKLLVLDEPTSQLDPIAAAEFLNTLVRINRNLGTTIVITEHRLEEIFPSADRVWVMDGGQIIDSGAPGAVAARLALGSRRHMISEAFPAAVRLYAGLKGDGMCPLTVKDGRNYARNLQRQRVQPSEIPARCATGKKRNKGAEAVRFDEVFFRYEKNSPDVLRGLNLTVGKGELCCILGGNGAGKSTALSVIGGLNRPYRGSVEILGRKAQSYAPAELYGKTLAALPQNPLSLFTSKTVLKELSQMASDPALLQEVVDRLGVGGLLESHPYDLSGGEQQKVAFAKILLCDPQIILLDEPTKGLDASYKRGFGAILKQLVGSGKTVIMATHDIEFAAEYATTCCLFFDGGISSQDAPGPFFAGNYFYTTAANRIARAAGSDAISVEGLLEEFKQ